MTLGLIYAALALAGFGTLGVLHKMADVLRCRPAAVSFLLYCWSLAFLLGIVLVWRGESLASPGMVVGIALPFGVSASIAILALQSALPYGSIATSWLAINLSAGIPTVASILVYREPVNLKKGLALALIVLSIGLLWKDKQLEEGRR
jgi:drug/metabolite transporter (DMT)-like permease